jgi:hypothetical protein
VRLLPRPVSPNDFFRTILVRTVFRRGLNGHVAGLCISVACPPTNTPRNAHHPIPNTVRLLPRPVSPRLFPNDPGADRFSTRARWACRWALYFGRMSPHQHTTQRTPSSYHVSTVLNARVVGLVEPVWSEWLAWSVWSEWLVSEWLLDHAR